MCCLKRGLNPSAKSISPGQSKYSERLYDINPLPHMPILGYSNSAAIKDMMSKIWTNGDTSICSSRKDYGKKEKLLVMSNFSFSQNVFKSSLLLMC